ncbi:MAG TPA: formate--tetrahydrofolate ligase [Dehalococcoidia bacterium]|nr:formate--tetrahydrofolate ligase [Dehalococcoidia bacterium]
MNHISKILKKLGLDNQEIIYIGKYKAKIPFESIKEKPGNGKLIVVTGMTPTKAGEGKTTTAIGLTQGLNKLGKSAVASLREPSLGPVFGIKGGGTGGGKSKVIPEDEINIHFTGDAHAIGSAHNLLAALVDNAIQRNQISNMDSSGITWNRVTDVLDRGLRNIVIGMGGGNNAPLRETSFDIVAASEIMAIMALSKNLDDLRSRLLNIVIGYDNSQKPIYVKDFDFVGSLLSILRYALMPNIVQTTEGNPAIIHTGPFGNIAHGCSSVIGDTFATQVSDYVLSEAGFGADLGFEKFMHIKSRTSDLKPQGAVIVGTIRAIKSHGGIKFADLTNPNSEAINKGIDNLFHHINNISKFGLKPVVALNIFPDDKAEEIKLVKSLLSNTKAFAVVESDSYSKGGDGNIELGEAVIESSKSKITSKYIYELEDTIKQKVHKLATNIYNANDVKWSPVASRKVKTFESNGWGNMPICMAKTPLSISHNPRLKSLPKDYTFEITDIRASVGAGFIYPIAGSIMTMPGLPTNPRSLDIDSKGNIKGELTA